MSSIQSNVMRARRTAVPRAAPPAALPRVPCQYQPRSEQASISAELSRLREHFCQAFRLDSSAHGGAGVQNTVYHQTIPLANIERKASISDLLSLVSLHLTCCFSALTVVLLAPTVSEAMSANVNRSTPIVVFLAASVYTCSQRRRCLGSQGS